MPREGTDPSSAVGSWLSAATLDLLGERCEEVVFRAHHLSDVVGVRLTSGRIVVVKARPWEPRLVGCAAVHRWMFDHGYPCPELIVDVVNRDGLAISIEAFASAGSMSSRDAQQPALHARWLERFVRLAPDASAIPTLQPSPPWLDWDLPRAVLWPTADDRPEDLNTILHASWIDDLAAAARRILVSTSLPWKVGHGDWESFNLSWDRDELVAAYDVDSVVALPEAAIAGAASAVFPACGEPVTADAAGCDAFLDAYAQARQQAWNDEERRVAWAAGTWLMAYNAKKESIDGLGPLQSQLRRDGRDRMARMATAM